MAANDFAAAKKKWQQECNYFKKSIMRAVDDHLLMQFSTLKEAFGSASGSPQMECNKNQKDASSESETSPSLGGLVVRNERRDDHDDGRDAKDFDVELDPNDDTVTPNEEDIGSVDSSDSSNSGSDDDDDASESESDSSSVEGGNDDEEEDGEANQTPSKKRKSSPKSPTPTREVRKAFMSMLKKRNNKNAQRIVARKEESKEYQRFQKTGGPMSVNAVKTYFRQRFPVRA